MSANLMATFYQACTLFNALPQGNNLAALDLLLHHDVIMKKIDDAQHALLGKPAVSGYLGGKGKTDNAQFNPIGTPDSAETFNVGLVWGPAQWKDKAAATTTFNIEYSFAFRKDTSGDWLIQLLWAAIV